MRRRSTNVGRCPNPITESAAWLPRFEANSGWLQSPVRMRRNWMRSTLLASERRQADDISGVAVVRGIAPQAAPGLSVDSASRRETLSPKVEELNSILDLHELPRVTFVPACRLCSTERSLSWKRPIKFKHGFHQFVAERVVTIGLRRGSHPTAHPSPLHDHGHNAGSLESRRPCPCQASPACRHDGLRREDCPLQAKPIRRTWLFASAQALIPNCRSAMPPDLCRVPFRCPRSVSEILARILLVVVIISVSRISFCD